MNRFLTWPLIVLVLWVNFMLYVIFTIDEMSWVSRVALFNVLVTLPVCLGVWYGTSIRKQGVK